MVPYNTPQAIRPLEKMVCDFAYSNGYDPISVFNDFLRYVIHGFSPAHRPLWTGNTNGSRTGILWKCLPDGYGSCSGNCNPADGLMRSVTSSCNILQSGRQVNGQFFTPRISATDGLMYRFGGGQRQENVSVTRHAEAEGCCWHIMYATW